MSSAISKARNRFRQYLRDHPVMYACFQFVAIAIVTILPVLLGMFYSEDLPFIGPLAPKIKNIIFSVFLALLLILTFLRDWAHKRTLKEEYQERAARDAFSQAYFLVEEKRNQYIRKIQRLQMALPIDSAFDNIEFIQRIGRNLESVLSQITKLDNHYLSIAIIGRFGKDDPWQWLLRNDLSSTFDLNEFVEIDPTTVFNQLENKHFIFYNDKKKAAEDNQYHMGRRDKVYNGVGSILGFKVVMSDFNSKLSECRITIATHGAKFTDKISLSAVELEILLLHSIFPYYQKLLETELARLYITRNTTQRDCIDARREENATQS